MGICLDGLCTEKQSSGTRNNVDMQPGFYIAKIGKAEVKLSKAKNKYMSLRLQCNTLDRSSSAGLVWDCITTSDSKWAQYKLARLLQACNVPLKGELELEDIAKIIAGREIIIDVKQRDDDPSKFEVDPFTHECYYPLSELDTLKGNPATIDDGFMNIPEDADEETSEW